jgi:hypothetical protein
LFKVCILKTIKNSNQNIESNNNKFSYDQLVFVIITLCALICCLILFIWVVQENNDLLNAKIEALLVEQQSEAKKSLANITE